MRQCFQKKRNILHNNQGVAGGGATWQQINRHTAARSDVATSAALPSRLKTVCTMCTQGGAEEQQLGSTGWSVWYWSWWGCSWSWSWGWGLINTLQTNTKKCSESIKKQTNQKDSRLERWRHTEKLCRWVFSVSNVVPGCLAGKTLVATRQGAGAKQQQQQHNFTL